jgi:hypothetical protein
MHCHHEKTTVIDDRVAFVGGIDLTSESGSAWTPVDQSVDRIPRPHWRIAGGPPPKRRLKRVATIRSSADAAGGGCRSAA